MALSEPQEIPVIFRCEGEHLLGILHQPAVAASMGVVLVVGGPQYRVGSHRQFVLLARMLARNGVAVFRFDYRGMGDSEGARRDFEAVSQDIRAAVDAFMEKSSGVGRVVLWGLCDAASAISFYGASDARVAGLVLLNPWVRTEEGQAQAYVRSYYVRRLFSRDLWKKVLRGGFNAAASAKSLGHNLSTAVAGRNPGVCGVALPERLLSGLSAFRGRILFVLSGNDLTADEFRLAVQGNRGWDAVIKRPGVTWRELKEANHTFSSREWRDQVAQWTLEWLMAGDKA